MRWFKYVWIAVLGFLWILWTIGAIRELIKVYKNQDERYNFLDAVLYAFEWKDYFAGWFITHTLIITVGSFIVWIMSRIK